MERYIWYDHELRKEGADMLRYHQADANFAGARKDDKVPKKTWH